MVQLATPVNTFLPPVTTFADFEKIRPYIFRGASIQYKGKDAGKK
jgi:hypothetical protein